MVPTKKVVGTKLATLSKRASRLGRPNHPKELKLRLAKAACEPDVSVAQLALKHGINANLLFKWRRHYLAGEFDASAKPALLPVTVVEEIDSTTREPVPAPLSAPAAPDVGKPSKIEVQFADALVRIDSGVDVSLLRTVLAALRA